MLLFVLIIISRYLVFNRPLEKDISGDTSGHLKKILLSLLHGERPDTNEVNEDEAENDARTLYEAGEKKWGTDESKFVEILSTRRFSDFVLCLCSSSFFRLAMHNSKQFSMLMEITVKKISKQQLNLKQVEISAEHFLPLVRQIQQCIEIQLFISFFF